MGNFFVLKTDPKAGTATVPLKYRTLIHFQHYWNWDLWLPGTSLQWTEEVSSSINATVLTGWRSWHVISHTFCWQRTCPKKHTWLREVRWQCEGGRAPVLQGLSKVAPLGHPSKSQTTGNFYLYCRRFHVKPSPILWHLWQTAEKWRVGLNIIVSTQRWERQDC